MPEDLSLTPIHPVDLGEADDDENGQVSDEELTALAGPDAAADTFPYYTADHGSPAAASVTALTEFARSLLADPDQASMRTTLGISGSGAPLTDMEALKAEGGGEILVHETDPGEDGTGTDLYLSQDGLGVLRQLQVRDADDTPFADFGSDAQFPFLSRPTTSMMSSNRDAMTYYAGEHGPRGDEYGNFLVGPNLAITDTVRSDGQHNVWNHFYYRLRSNFLYAGAGFVVQDVSDNPEMRIRRFASPKTTVDLGADPPLVIGYTPVTLPTVTMGTDPESLVVASTTTTGTNALNSTTITVASVADFKGTSATVLSRQAKIGSTWVTYTGKNTGVLTGCSAHPAFPAGTAVVQSQWESVGSNKNFTAWPDIDHGGRANFDGDYPYTIGSQGGTEDYAGIVVVVDGSGTEEDPDPEIGDTESGGNLRLGSILYKRLEFGATPGMLEAVGCWQHAKGNYTITTTPQDIILKRAFPFPLSKNGRVLKEGNATPITYRAYTANKTGSDATLQGLGAIRLLDCTVASGSLSITDGDKIFQRVVVNTGDSLKLVAKPEPRPGSALTNYDIGDEPLSGGRFGAGTYYIGDDAVAGNDTWMGLAGEAFAAISFQMVEPFTETRQGGQLQLSSASTGTKGAKPRVTLESYGLLNAMFGVSLGIRRDLGPKNSVTPSVLNDGQYARTNVNQFTVDNTGMSTATVAVTTTTAGDATHNEVQLLTLTGTPVEGDSFTLTWTDPDAVTATSVPVVFNDTPDVPSGVLLTALQSTFPSGDPVSLFVAGDLAVTHPTTSTWTVTFGTKVTGTSSRFGLNNSSSTTITNITDGFDGHLIHLRALNANTTVDHLAGGDGQIRLSGGAPVTLASNQEMTLVYDFPSKTWGEIGGSSGGALADNSVTSAKIAAGAIMDTDVNSSAAIGYSKLAAMTASRALVSDSGGKVSTSAATATQVGYLSGVTSAIQTQLNAKQASATPLTALGAVTPAANKVPYFTGAGAATVTDLSAFGRSLIDDADAAAHLTTLGITASVAELNYVDGVTSSIQTQINALSSGGVTDPELLALAELTSAADTLPYFTGPGTAAVAPFTSFGRDLVAEGNAPDVLTLLGLNIVTPESFAAAGDGTTDDTAALGNWIAADGVKVAPAGKTYLISGTLTFAAAGDFDFGGSTITAKNSSTSKILVTGDDVTLRNLVFDGRRTGTSVVSQGIEWRGANGLCVNVESSNHNDCEGGFALLTGSPTLTCVRCRADLNGNTSSLRTTGLSGAITAGVDGFCADDGKLVLDDCDAHGNTRSGVFTSWRADDGCHVSGRYCGNASVALDSGTRGVGAIWLANVDLRSNRGTTGTIFTSGGVEGTSGDTRWGISFGEDGGTNESGVGWTIGDLICNNYTWWSGGSAADGVHLRTKSSTVTSITGTNVQGYLCDFMQAWNNVSGDTASMCADTHVGKVTAQAVSNPAVVFATGIRCSVGEIFAKDGSTGLSISEGVSSPITNCHVGRVTTIGSPAGTVIAAGYAATIKNFRIDEVVSIDCQGSALVGYTDSVVILDDAQVTIGSVWHRTASGVTKPDYVVDFASSGHQIGQLDGSTDYNTALVHNPGNGTIGGKSRTELVTAGAGLITSSGPESQYTGAFAIATGTLYWHAVGLKKGDSITNALAKMTSVGSSLSLAKMCVATVSGTTATVVAVSANVTSTFTSGANKWATVPCAYTAPADGLYYIGILAVGTTGPTCMRTQPQTSIQVGSNPFQYGQTTGQTDIVLSSTYTVATNTNSLLLAVN